MLNGEDDRIVMISSKGYNDIVNTPDGKNINWTSDIKTEMPVKVKFSGEAS